MIMKSKKLICIKLSNGETVIGTLKSETSLSYNVENILSVIFETMSSISLINWVIGVKMDKSIQINKNHVISLLNPNKHLTDMYFDAIIKIIKFEEFKEQSLIEQEGAMREYNMIQSTNTPIH